MLAVFIHRLGINKKILDLVGFLIKKLVDKFVGWENKRTALFQAVNNSIVFFLT